MRSPRRRRSRARILLDEEPRRPSPRAESNSLEAPRKITVHGRVLGPDGRPVADAKIYRTPLYGQRAVFGTRIRNERTGRPLRVRVRGEGRPVPSTDRRRGHGGELRARLGGGPAGRPERRPDAPTGRGPADHRPGRRPRREAGPGRDAPGAEGPRRGRRRPRPMARSRQGQERTERSARDAVPPSAHDRSGSEVHRRCRGSFPTRRHRAESPRRGATRRPDHRQPAAQYPDTSGRGPRPWSGSRCRPNRP